MPDRFQHRLYKIINVTYGNQPSNTTVLQYFPWTALAIRGDNGNTKGHRFRERIG
jgi:hypothetical protein